MKYNKSYKRNVSKNLEKKSVYSVKCSFTRKSTKAMNIYVFPNEEDETY